jgi:hypothetical protein
MCDFEHYVEGEGDHGAPYHGFIRSDGAVNLTIKNAKITPRFIYYTASKIPGKDVSMGSYDLSFWASINVTCENVKQTIDITDTRYWGVYTSNFCKNLVLDGCVFSRFDAHQGVTNATIRNCHLGHQHIQLIGAGEFLIENTTVHMQRGFFIFLRGDYGSTFDGNITIRNCKWMTESKNISVIGAHNTEDHDFGYPCFMGRNIDIDGLEVTDLSGNADKEQKLFLLGAYNQNETDAPTPFPYTTPKNLRVHKVTVGSGSYRITPRPDKYKDLDVETVI